MLKLVFAFNLIVIYTVVAVNVVVFHFILPHHGFINDGYEVCSSSTNCSWLSGSGIPFFNKNLQAIQKTYNGEPLITLSLYNIHSWWEKSKRHAPAACEIKTNYTMAESEESQARYGARIFDLSFKYFDGIA